MAQTSNRLSMHVRRRYGQNQNHYISKPHSYCHSIQNKVKKYYTLMKDDNAFRTYAPDIKQGSQVQEYKL